MTVLLLCGSGAVCHAEERAEKLREARALVAAGRLEEAARIYGDLVAGSPNDPGLRMNLVVTQFKAGRYNEVIEQARAVLRLDPDAVGAWLFLGASHFQLGQKAEAIEPLEKVVALKLGERNARLMLAESLLLLERHGEAARHFHHVSELLPENPRVWYGIERSFRALADEAARELERLAPDSAYHHALLADAWFDQRQDARAFHHYREALARRPDLRGLHGSLAAVYEAAGHPEWAATERGRERGAACGDDSAECRFAAGRYRDVCQASTSPYWRVKACWQLAGEALSRLSALPPSAQLHELKARDLDGRGRHLEASREWREALRLSPGNAVITKGLAVSLFRRRDFEAALPLLQRLRKQQPESAELSFLSGSTLLNMERPEEAIPLLEDAVRRDAQLLDARGELGRAYLRVGQPERAVPYLRAALAADEDGSRHFQLVRAYRASGQEELATEALAQYQAFQARVEAERREVEKRYRIVAP